MRTVPVARTGSRDDPDLVWVNVIRLPLALAATPPATPTAGSPVFQLECRMVRVVPALVLTASATAMAAALILAAAPNAGSPGLPGLPVALPACRAGCSVGAGSSKWNNEINVAVFGLAVIGSGWATARVVGSEMGEGGGGQRRIPRCVEEGGAPGCVAAQGNIAHRIVPSNVGAHARACVCGLLAVALAAHR